MASYAILPSKIKKMFVAIKNRVFNVRASLAYRLRVGF